MSENIFDTPYQSLFLVLEEELFAELLINTLTPTNLSRKEFS